MSEGIESKRMDELELLIAEINRPLDVVGVLNCQCLTKQELMFVKDMLRRKFPYLCEDCEEEGVIRSID
ncbi:hypothetical protein ACFL2R_00460 [Patescibacteria group bacterium]